MGTKRRRDRGQGPALAVDSIPLVLGDGSRMHALQDHKICLRSRAPVAGDFLERPFSIPPARLADGPLTTRELSTGLWVVSTLPNIEKHSCAMQVAELDERIRHAEAPFRLAFVSSDEASHWSEVDRHHPGVRGSAYSLDGASEADRQAFAETFGVGVISHRRIARGLFALLDGVFVAVHIPFQQAETPAVSGFVARLQRLVSAFGRMNTPTLR